MRLVTATTVFLAVVFGTSAARTRLRLLTRRDWIELFFSRQRRHIPLSVQLRRVASSGPASPTARWIIGVSPIVIAIMSAIGRTRAYPSGAVAWHRASRWPACIWSSATASNVGADVPRGFADDGRRDLLGGGIRSHRSRILKRHPPLIVIALDVLDRRDAVRADDDADPDRGRTGRAISGFSWADDADVGAPRAQPVVLDLVHRA